MPVQTILVPQRFRRFFKDLRIDNTKVTFRIPTALYKHLGGLICTAQLSTFCPDEVLVTTSSRNFIEFILKCSPYVFEPDSFSSQSSREESAD